jgi:hypothetical protein
MLALIMGILADAVWEAFDVVGFIMIPPPPTVPHWAWITLISVGVALPIISAVALISQYRVASRERQGAEEFFVGQLARQREDIVDAVTNKIQAPLPESAEKKTEEIGQEVNRWLPPQISPEEYAQRRREAQARMAANRQKALVSAYDDFLKKDPGSKSGNS